MREVDVEWEDTPAFRRVKALLEDGDEWWVEFRTSYAGYREFGTGPAAGHGRYMPPVDAIKRWASDKLGLSGKELDRAVGAIRWGIYQHGTEAEPFARPAVAEAASMAAELMAETYSLEPVAQYIAQRSREIIDATQTDSGMMADQIYVVHRRTE